MPEQPRSESVERPWASNDKLQFDNAIGHSQAMLNYSELAIKQALDFQQKAGDDYLLAQRQLRDEYMKHSGDRDSKALDNDRYTLDRLYSVFPEEAAGLSTLVKLVVEELRKDE